MIAELHPDSAKVLSNDYLSQLFTTRLNNAIQISQRYEKFWTYARDVALAGGKRIRPYLTMIGYGGIDKKILPVAVAQELIHIAMLIHDDVIDQDDKRHGKKNMNGLYKQDYRDYLEQPMLGHYANSAAVLAGDALISEAYLAISNSSFSDEVKRAVTEQMHLSIYDVIGGELLDVEAAFITDTDFDPMQIYRYKTSSYSFIGPLLAGAYCAGADKQTLTTLREFATNLGIAFQIQDDLLGVFGDERETGKSTLTDLREGKQTLLVRYHQESMDTAMRERFVEFGNNLAPIKHLEQIKRDMQTSGAQQKTSDAAVHYFELAQNHLHELQPGVRYDALQKILNSLKERKQ